MATAKKMIASKTLLTPQGYLEKVTGQFYVGGAIGSRNVVKDIRRLLVANGKKLNDYAMNDIEGVMQGGRRAVVVDCSHFKDIDTYVNEYRWFQI